MGNLVQDEHWTPLNFGWNRGAVAVLRKPAISLKRGKIGPRLLLMTNRKSHSRFRLVPKSTNLDDLEGPLRTLFQNKCVFRSPPRKVVGWAPILSATKCSPMTLDSGNIRFMGIFAVVLKIYENLPLEYRNGMSYSLSRSRQALSY